MVREIKINNSKKSRQNETINSLIDLKCNVYILWISLLFQNMNIGITNKQTSKKLKHYMQKFIQ